MRARHLLPTALALLVAACSNGTGSTDDSAAVASASGSAAATTRPPAETPAPTTILPTTKPPPTAPSSTTVPTQPGVGRRRFGLDPSGTPALSRPVTVTVFYPSEDVSGHERAALAGDVEDAIAQSFEHTPPGFFAGLPSNSFDSPPIAPGPIPVLLFQGGDGYQPFVYEDVIERIVEHGYAVAAVSPFPIDTPEVGEIKTDPSIIAADLRAVLAELDAINASTFGGQLDLSTVGAFGHSSGGSAALSAGRDDARIAAVSNIDSYVPAADGQPVIAKPLLLVGSHSPGQPAIDAVPAAPGYFVRIEGVTHNGLATTIASIARQHPNVIGVTQFGAIEPARTADILTAYLTEFFDRHLLGEASELESLGARFPEVTFATSG